MADTKTAVYFAGFFDGEGSVAIYPRKYVVSLTNTDIRPLLLAESLWGGSIATQREDELGVQTIYRWQIYGHSARAFLEEIRPFVMVKGEQIDWYLEALAFVPVGRGQRYQGDAKVEIDRRAAQLRLLKRGRSA